MSVVDDDTDTCEVLERRQVALWRQDQARKAGLTVVEARLFAESDQDLEELRQLSAAGCPHDLLARIVL